MAALVVTDTELGANRDFVDVGPDAGRQVFGTIPDAVARTAHGSTEVPAEYRIDGARLTCTPGLLRRMAISPLAFKERVGDALSIPW